MEKKTIYYLAKSLDACAYYRLMAPAKYLERNHNWKCYFDIIDDVVEIEPNGMLNFDKIKKSRMEYLEQADVIVLQRGTDEGHVKLLQFIQDKLKKPVIYNADDNYIDIPEWNTGYQYFAPRKIFIEQMIQRCDGMEVTVEQLKKFYSKYNSNIGVIKNCIDFEKIDKDLPYPETAKEIGPQIYRSPSEGIEDKFIKHAKDQIARMLSSHHEDVTEENIARSMKMAMHLCFQVPFENYREVRDDENRIMIGWGGSPTHVLDLETVREPITEVLRRYQMVNMTMVGFVYMLNALNKSRHKVCLHKWLKDLPLDRFWIFNLFPVKNYYSAYKTLGWEIGIAPVEENIFNACKSNIKVLEYMALGVYPVATKFDTYIGVMEDETSTKTDIGRGRLCKTREDWKQNLYDILNQPKMRHESIEWNKKFVREHYNVEKEAVKWDEWYRRFV